MIFNRKNSKSYFTPKAVEDKSLGVVDDSLSFHAFLNLPSNVYLALKLRSLKEKKRMTAIVRELVIREFSGNN